MSEHAATQHYQHETRQEGGWGNQPEGTTTTRVFFGVSKSCHCADCVKARNDEIWEHMQRRKMVAGDG